MKKTQEVWNMAAAAAGMFLLILDAKTALKGAYQGVCMCIQTVIPSLFPFFVLSGLLTGNLTQLRCNGLNWLSKLLRIPRNAVALWITGLLGGYPIGAKCICQNYDQGNLDRSTAHRLMGFCSNAGPAFIFGMTALYFPGKHYPWILFAIQILSSFLAGVLLPGESQESNNGSFGVSISWNEALQNALDAMLRVCGWIVLFKVLLNVCNRWFLWLLPGQTYILIAGLAELSNGILELNGIEDLSLRLILCSLFLNFGGLCVVLQTAAVSAPVGLGYYLPGKLLQSAVSLFLSTTVCSVMHGLSPVFILLSGIPVFFYILNLLSKKKKTVAISRSMLYNG